MRIKVPDLVGREKEIGKMRKALDKAKGGEGQSVFVSGDAGTGKTRIVNDVLTMASKEGFKCLTSKCLFLEGSDPYLPFTDALREHLQAAKAKEGALKEEEEDTRGPSGILPMGLMGIGEDAKTEPSRLAGRKAKRASGTGTDFSKERERMFSDILSIISDLTVTQPVALFLDDLHWADTATLQLLSYVIRNSLDQRILIIGAYRTGEVEAKKGHPLKEVIQRARRERRNTDIKLTMLKKDGVGAMIGSMFEVDKVPAGFTEVIFKETEGNPFFIGEVLRSLVEEGVVAEDGSNLKGVDVGKVKVPRSVSDLITRKVESLNDIERKVLDYSAIIGTSFSIDLLSKVVDMDEMELVDLLERLMELKIVDEFTEEGDIKYRFVHKQFREVLYNNLSSARKRLFHKKIGFALEGLPEKKREVILFSLAHHLSMALELTKAIEYTYKAAERAENSFAAEDAITFYEKALELLNRLPPEKEAIVSKKDMVSKIAELKFLTESWAEAMQYLTALEKVAVKQEDESTLAQVYRKMGHIERMRGAWDRAMKRYDKALLISEKIDDMLGIAETLEGLGHILAVKADYEIARAYLEKSIDISKELEDDLLLGRTHLELGHVFKDQGAYDDALAIYTDGLMLLEKAGDQFSMTRGYMAIGDLCIRTKEWNKAIEFYEKAQGMAEKTKDNQMRGWALFKLGECFAQKKEFEKAEDHCSKAYMALLRADDRVGLAYVYSAYGVVFRLKGDFGKAFVQFQQAMNTADDLDMPAIIANINLEIGLMYKDKEDNKSAKRFFEKSKKLYEKVGAKALEEQADRLLGGLERYEKPKDMQHYLDKSMKAMQKRAKRKGKGKDRKGKNKKLKFRK